MRSLTALLLAVALASRAGLAQETPPACPFGPGDLPATISPGEPHGTQIPIDHIVVLIHYFGRMPGQRVKRASNPDPLGGAPIRPFHQTRKCEVADLGHGWNASHREWNGGAMDGFPRARRLLGPRSAPPSPACPTTSRPT